jgi:hypothetical protein
VSSGIPLHDISLTDLDEQRVHIAIAAHSQATWQKVVETPARPPITHPPRPPRPPRPPQSLPVLRHIPYGTPFRSKFLFWLSLFLLLLAVGAGLFGLSVTFGRGPAFVQQGLTLVVSPDIAPVGMKISLHGQGFTPGGQVGLFRDNGIPLPIVQNSVVAVADSRGDMVATVQIGTDWGDGEHTLMAEDAYMHRSTSFPIQVTGATGLLRPAHFRLSTNMLDLGTGDQATNTLQTVTLTNSGSGQIAWQGTTTQPWLMISPHSGSLASGQPAQVTVAVNRYNLAPGDYSARVFFSSDAGDSTLDITMHVSALLAGAEAVLQLTPAVLAFEAVDAGNKPAPQVVTVSNPGHRALHWRATSSMDWLTLSQHAGEVGPSLSSAVSVGVRTATLLPGVHSGDITFVAEDSALDTPQHIYVSITVLPQCSLRVFPGLLNFNGTFQQGSPMSQQVSLSSSQSCASPAHWSASSSEDWVTISATSGTAPGTINVVVDPRGLAVGAHSASIMFTAGASSQVVLVNFALANSSASGLALGASALNFQGVVNGGNPALQSLDISNIGASQVFWQASARTNDGTNWLSLDTTSGLLNTGQSATLAVNVINLAALVPGSYSGTIAVAGIDSAGHSIAGGSLAIPVNLQVDAACSLSVSATAQTFSVLAGATSPATASVNVVASNSCQHPLRLTTSASTASGGNWLQVSPVNSTLTSSVPTAIMMQASSTALVSGTYHGSLAITAVDTVTNASLPALVPIYVTLNVQPPCTLQTPSASALTFNENAGVYTDVRTFTVGVVGTCVSGAVSLVPTPLMAGTPWFTVSPSTLSVQPGVNATFTVTINTSQLQGTSYQGTISIAALESGMAIVGSPRTVGVNLTIAVPPALSVSPMNGVTFSLDSGTSASQTLAVSNVGGGSLSWTAHLRSDAPSFLSLTTGTTPLLAAGGATSFTVTADATTAAAGSYTTAILIDAQDATTAQPLGAELAIPVTISVTIPATAIPTMPAVPTVPAGPSVPSPTVSATSTSAAAGTTVVNATAAVPTPTPAAATSTVSNTVTPIVTVLSATVSPAYSSSEDGTGSAHGKGRNVGIDRHDDRYDNRHDSR